MFDICDILGGAEPKNKVHLIEPILQPYTRDIISMLHTNFGDDRTCLRFLLFLGAAYSRNLLGWGRGPGGGERMCPPPVRPLNLLIIFSLCQLNRQKYI